MGTRIDTPPLQYLIKKYVDETGKSQREIERDCQIRQSRICKFISGDRAPSQKEADRLANYFMLSKAQKAVLMDAISQLKAKRYKRASPEVERLTSLLRESSTRLAQANAEVTDLKTQNAALDKCLSKLVVMSVDSTDQRFRDWGRAYINNAN